MRINPEILASTITRYNHVVKQQSAKAQAVNPTDKVEISERARTYTNLIKGAHESEEVSKTRVHAAMNRIASGSYEVDFDQLANRMMGIDLKKD